MDIEQPERKYGCTCYKFQPVADIVFCFQFNALVTTLFSTAFVEVVLNAASIVIALSQAGCLTQELPSERYQSFTDTGSVSTAVLGTHCVYVAQKGL